MGLDLYCNGKSRKCSYSFVQRIRLLLLRGLLEHVKINLSNESEIIKYLEMLCENDEVAYEKYNEDMENKLRRHCLQGFSSFIWHSDGDSILNSYEAEKFMETWKLTYQSMDRIIKWENDDKRKYDEFYFQSVFDESIDSGSVIYFC